ncbi:MAG: hypothetical protein AAGF26_15980 [Cyanobacteria bacterium P01_G01_bin.49]
MNRSKSPSYIVLLDNHWRLNCLLPHLATITNPKGQRHTTYFGFNSYREAQAFYQYLMTNQLCLKAITRRSQRLSQYNFEIKAWGVGNNLLVRILNRASKSLIDCLGQFQQAS